MSNPLQSRFDEPPAGFSLLPAALRRAWRDYASEQFLKRLAPPSLPGWKIAEQRGVMTDRIGMLLEQGWDASQIERYFAEMGDASRRGS